MISLENGPAEAARRITPRAPKLAYDGVPHHWMRGDPVATQLANGVNLLFPAGERFFIRSVKRYADRIDDAELRAQVRAFYAQEGRHAVAHERYFETLEAQGYDVQRFLELYEKIAYDWLERSVPGRMRLAVTAALEHYTAIMAKGALSEVDALQGAHPAMRALLLWHAAEEIEHKAVAYEVLRHVAPGYGLRVAGMVLATITMVGFWAWATTMLLRQDARAGRPVKPTAAAHVPNRSIARDVFLRGIVTYLRPSFHPLDDDDLALARDYLASAGMAT